MLTDGFWRIGFAEAVSAGIPGGCMLRNATYLSCHSVIASRTPSPTDSPRKKYFNTGMCRRFGNFHSRHFLKISATEALCLSRKVSS